MKKTFLLLLGLMTAYLSSGQDFKQQFVSTDIDNFWLAYDKIVTTKDTTLQKAYLQEFYLDKATAGLQSLRQVRNYTEKQFLEAINSYPKFWQSIRTNTQDYKKHLPEINADIEKLRKLYPSLKPSTIYFSIGVFRSGGTTHLDRILIGGELSLADENTIIDELPAWRQPFYKQGSPIDDIALLCTHEYIHTQQKELVENLLSMCLYEGIAEFVSCKATGKKSSSPAIDFGKVNSDKIINHFVKDLFLISNNFNWLWGENRNDLKVRDLGYYIGYEISERYYNLSDDKTKAIKELIELDYTNEPEVARIVDKTKLLPKPLNELYDDYEKQRPTVESVKPFKSNNQKVKPGMTKIVVVFSEPLNGHHTSIDYGPLGADFFPKVNSTVWSEDKKSWTIEADLKPNQHYQILISNNFRKENGVRLKPYLIDFKTTK